MINKGWDLENNGAGLLDYCGQLSRSSRLPAGSSDLIKKKRSELLRRFEEKIDRKIIYFKDGRRKQLTRKTDTGKRNPEKVTVAVGGDWEVFAYPYANPERIFLRIKDAIECFEVDDLSRLFSRVSARIKRYRSRLGRGVRRMNISGCLFQSAMEAGNRRFSERQSQNKLLYMRGVVFMPLCETCTYYLQKLQSDGLCGKCRSDRKHVDWILDRGMGSG